MKRILLFVIAEFERDRQFVGRKLARYADKKDKLTAELEKVRQLAEERKKWEAEQAARQKEENAKELEEWPSDRNVPPAVNPEDVINLVEDIEQKQEQELEELRNENKMLQTLATTGIITNMFMHEIRTSTNNIGLELNAAYEAIKYDNDVDYALDNILRAIGVKKTLRHGLVSLSNPLKRTNEREKGIIFRPCWNSI